MLFGDTKHAALAIEQRASPAASDPTPEIVAQRAGDYSNHDHPPKRELVLGNSKRGGEQERRLAGQRNPSVLEQKDDGNRPVAILSKVLTQQVKEVHASSGRIAEERGIGASAIR